MRVDSLYLTHMCNPFVKPNHFIKSSGLGPYNSSLTPSVLTEVPVPSQKSQLSCTCVLGVSMLPLYDFFI